MALPLNSNKGATENSFHTNDLSLPQAVPTSTALLQGLSGGRPEGSKAPGRLLLDTIAQNRKIHNKNNEIILIINTQHHQVGFSPLRQELMWIWRSVSVVCCFEISCRSHCWSVGVGKAFYKIQSFPLVDTLFKYLKGTSSAKDVYK